MALHSGQQAPSHVPPDTLGDRRAPGPLAVQVWFTNMTFQGEGPPASSRAIDPYSEAEIYFGGARALPRCRRMMRTQPRPAAPQHGSVRGPRNSTMPCCRANAGMGAGVVAAVRVAVASECPDGRVRRPVCRQHFHGH